MAYLIANDFKKLIQADNLTQIINGDLSILDSAMLDSQSTAMEMLVQKYVLDQEFLDTNKYDNTISYTPGQRVFLDAIPYNATSTYILGNLVLQAGSIYKCTTAIPVAEAFNSSHWLLLGLQFSLYFVPYPFQQFILNKYYRKSDQVYWNGKTYVCQIATALIPHELLLQYQTYSNVPNLNVFPDDPTNGIQFWGIGTSVTVAAGQLPTGWKQGDNRNRSLVRHCVAIALYIVHTRISPRNIPELRVIAYMGKAEDIINAKNEVIYPVYSALGWLQAAGKGDLTAGLPVIQPRSGGRVRWGSVIKNQNNY